MCMAPENAIFMQNFAMSATPDQAKISDLISFIVIVCLLCRVTVCLSPVNGVDLGSLHKVLCSDCPVEINI